MMVDRIQYHIPDWNAGTESLSFEEEAVYRKLCDCFYLTDGNLKDDDRLNAQRLKLSTRRFRLLKNRLVEQGKIELEDGYLRQSRARKELAKVLATSALARAKAERKWHKKTRKNEEKTKINQTKLQQKAEKTSRKDTAKPQKNNKTENAGADARADAGADAGAYANSLTRKLVIESSTVREESLTDAEQTERDVDHIVSEFKTTLAEHGYDKSPSFQFKERETRRQALDWLDRLPARKIANAVIEVIDEAKEQSRQPPWSLGGCTRTLLRAAEHYEQVNGTAPLSLEAQLEAAQNAHALHSEIQYIEREGQKRVARRGHEAEYNEAVKQMREIKAKMESRP